MARNDSAEKQMIQAVAAARAFDSSRLTLQPQTGQVSKTVVLCVQSLPKQANQHQS
jgi:hypothetical protein